MTRPVDSAFRPERVPPSTADLEKLEIELAQDG